MLQSYRGNFDSSSYLSFPLAVKYTLKKCNFSVKVLFPSGAKVEIARNYWGLDVSLFTPRAKDVNNERGLCLHNPATIDAEGMKER